MIGQTVSHYKILAKIGEGGMGVVYEAEDIKLGRRVAIKFLSEQALRDPLALSRFQREARAVSSLNHPHICTIYEIDEWEGKPFIALELLKGTTLSKFIGGKPVPEPRLLEIGIQAASALEAAHAQGIVHRDIKPANIFVTDSGAVKVLDFGLAKLAPRHELHTSGTTMAIGSVESTTGTGIIVGTVAYMSPEQVRGLDTDHRSDIFSFGAVLYEMATGKQAFGGTTSGVVFASILNEHPPSAIRYNRDLSAPWDSVLGRALEKDATLRYQTMSDFKAELHRIKRDSTKHTAPYDSTVRVAPKEPLTKKAKLTYAGVAAAVLLVALVAGWVIMTRPPRVESVAVLPFKTDDLEKTFVGDSLTEAISDGLSQIPELSTKAGSETIRFKDKEDKPSEIGKQLTVDAVITGSVMIRNTDFSLHLELVTAKDGNKIFGKRYNVEFSKEGVTKVLQEVTRDVAIKLKREVPPETFQHLAESVNEVLFTGGLYGSVYDSNSKPMPGVEVKLSHQKGLVRTAITDDAGKYRFARIPPGEGYRLEASLRDLRSDVREGLPSQPNVDRPAPPLILRTQ